MSPDRLRSQVEPILEALAERVHWAPAVFVPADPGRSVITAGATPKDVDLAQEVVGSGTGMGESALVGIDRWARVFPVLNGDRCFGHVALVARVAESDVPALERLVGVLASVFAGELSSLGERDRRRELEANQAELASRLHALDADRRFHEELHEEMSSGAWNQVSDPDGALGRIVGCLSRHLGGPVVLQARNLLVLAEAGAGSAGIVLVPSRHQSARDVVLPLSRSKGVVTLPAGAKAPRRMVLPVWSGGDLLGFLVAAPAGDEATGERSLECTAGFVAMERVIRSELESAQQLDREALLRDLFSGSSLHRLAQRGLRMDLDFRSPYIPCAFVPLAGDEVPLAPLRSLVIDALRETPGLVGEALGAVYDDAVVALVPEDAAGTIGAVCDRVVKRADAQGWKVRGGVGPTCRDLGDYETAVRKARWSVDALASVGGCEWAHFNDFGIYSILFDREQSTQLDEFVTRQLGPLLEYDEAHRTDLVETLRCVLDTGAVLTEAAKQLYIHISTLKYRVNRVEELLGVELRNPQSAFDLHLACKILAVRRQLTDGGAGLGPAGDAPVEVPARKRVKAVPDRAAAAGK